MIGGKNLYLFFSELNNGLAPSSSGQGCRPLEPMWREPVTPVRIRAGLPICMNQLYIVDTCVNLYI